MHEKISKNFYSDAKTSIKKYLEYFMITNVVKSFEVNVLWKDFFSENWFPYKISLFLKPILLTF